jgi:ankyrin repeat protein
MELLLKHGAQPDFDDWNRCTPLSQAIETGNAAVVELLLAQGANVDYQYRIVSKFNWLALDRQLTLSFVTITVGKWIKQYLIRSILDQRLTLSSFTIAASK